MSPPVSIKEVAARAGVSVGTVSNVLNRPEIVAVPTRDRVQAAIRALGFVRNEPARQLRAGQSRTIGLVVLDVANPFFTDMARGVEDEASRAGLSVILCNSDEQESRESRYLELLEEHRVQGVLITPVSAPDERLARLRARGTAVILVDARSASSLLCSVSVDDVLGGDLAVTHLLEGGHQRIAFVGGPAGLHQVADRREGGARALRRAGHDPDRIVSVVETAALNVAAGQTAGRGLAALPGGDAPDGSVLRQRPGGSRGPAGDDPQRHRRAGRDGDRGLRRHRVRGGGGRAAVLRAPATPGTRPHGRPAAHGRDQRDGAT